MRVIFEFPDDSWFGICEAFAATYNRPEKVPGEEGEIDNPETKADFTTAKIKQFVAEVWKPYAIRAQLATTQQQVIAAVEQRAGAVAEATSVTIDPTPGT